MASKTEMVESSINVDDVSAAFIFCSYKAIELKGVRRVPNDAVVVEGFYATYDFHPGRLEEQRPKVEEWLRVLPHQFRQNGDGGRSFSKAFNQEDGSQWASSPQQVDELLCLAIGLGLAEYLLPREEWDSLPGDMPFFVIFVD